MIFLRYKRELSCCFNDAFFSPRESIDLNVPMSLETTSLKCKKNILWIRIFILLRIILPCRWQLFEALWALDGADKIVRFNFIIFENPKNGLVYHIRVTQLLKHRLQNKVHKNLSGQRPQRKSRKVSLTINRQKRYFTVRVLLKWSLFICCFRFLLRKN